VSSWHALLHNRNNSLACWLPGLSLAGWGVGNPAPRWEDLPPFCGNLFAWAEAGAEEAQMVVVVPNSDSFLTEKIRKLGGCPPPAVGCVSLFKGRSIQG